MCKYLTQSSRPSSCGELRNLIGCSESRFVRTSFSNCLKIYRWVAVIYHGPRNVGEEGWSGEAIWHWTWGQGPPDEISIQCYIWRSVKSKIVIFTLKCRFSPAVQLLSVFDQILLLELFSLTKILSVYPPDRLPRQDLIVRFSRQVNKQGSKMSPDGALREVPCRLSNLTALP